MIKKKFLNSSMIAKIAIFSALSYVLYLFPKFHLPFFPFFLEVNFSDIPALICAFVLGPLPAVIVIFIKVLLKLPLSITLGVGELADLIIGVCFVLPPALMYKKNKTIKTALIGLLIGAALSTLGAIVSNIYLIVPAYVNVLLDNNFDALVGICKPFISDITAENFFVKYSLFIILPFNLLRCFVAGLLTFLLYKRISNLLHKF